MTPTEEADEVKSARSECFSRIGRNLVNAQRIELMLKYLLCVNYAGSIADFETRFKRHIEKISQMTLGKLIPTFSKAVLAIGNADDLPQGGCDVWFITKVNVWMDEESHTAWSDQWGKMRTERNRLVHVMLGGVNFDSPEQCRQLSEQLDAQNVLFLNGISFLSGVVIATKQTIAEMAGGELVFDPPLEKVLQG